MSLYLFDVKLQRAAPSIRARRVISYRRLHFGWQMIAKMHRRRRRSDTPQRAQLVRSAPKYTPRTHLPASSIQGSLQIVGVVATYSFHFMTLRLPLLPSENAKLRSQHHRCKSTSDTFCQACSAPADIFQQISQMKLGIQPRY
jgi:hypothetical protein